MKRGAVKGPENLDPLVNVLRLMSEKTRLNILLLLAGGDRNVTSICAELALPQPTVSHHLGLLRMQNLISSRRSGKQVFYGLNELVSQADGTDGLQINIDQFTLKIVARAPGQEAHG